MLRLFSFFMLEKMPENSFTMPSFAKINLFLQIKGKRADGFHELCTVFQTVSLCDFLTFEQNDEIALTCDDEKIPIDEKNLIVRAAKALRKRFDIKSGAKIHLEKCIPAPGGLGGGSSNAAVALLGLIKLWEIKIDFTDLCAIGGELGSDVPFFFYGGTALGTGRGTEIFPLEDFDEKYLLIVTPKVDVSTHAAFARINAPDLTNFGSKSILSICRDEVNSLYLRQSELKNDFERVIFEIEPEIAEAKRKLFDCGAKKALMSGSGASIFAVFETEEQRRNTLETLQGEQRWRVFQAETVSRSIYRNSLQIDKDFA